MKPDTSIQFLYVDLFCGAGGTSTGVESAKTKHGYCAKVIACVNHDANAIASHAANHPDTLHFTEDIRTLALDKLIKHVNAMRALYPNAKLILWASLECTNFSKAKGGQSRDADSRTLAEHLFRYIDALNPDYIQIENVEEFMTWCPLVKKIMTDKNGNPYSPTNKVKTDTGYTLTPIMIPDPDRIGECYERWIGDIKAYGYDYDYRILNSADFGAFTARKRYFGVFAKDGLPIVFPEPTHSRNGSNDLFDSLLKWKPVKECLDFSDEGESIFDRKKPLVEATLLRIHTGLIKFVAGGKDKWLLKYNSVNGKTRKHNPPGLDEPCPTVSCQGRLGLVQAMSMNEYLIQYNKGVDIAQTSFLSKYFSGDPYSKNISIEEPAGAITTVDHHSIVNAQFMQSYYGNGNAHSVDQPSPTITTKDRLSLVSPQYFMDMQYGNGTPSDINKPAPTLTTNPKHQLVQCDVARENHFIMNPQYKSAGGSVEKPCFTLIARMDKMPPYLIEASNDTKDIPSFIKVIGDTVIFEIYEDDSQAMKDIKEFMAIYQIIDIRMRMLRIPELKMIMGFPKDYILIGTQADQKKSIGNAVEVKTARAMCEALADKFLEINKQIA